MYTNEMFLVNNLITDEIVTANYKVATLLPAQLFFVTQSLLVYFMPKFVKYKDSPSKLWNYSMKVGFFNFLLIGFICVIALILTPLMIQVMYGDAYMECVALSRKFWIAYGINAAIRIVPLNVLASTGHEKLNSFFAIFGCGVHFIVAWTILKYIGIEQLPIAISIVYVFVGFLAWFFLQRNTRMQTY